MDSPPTLHADAHIRVARLLLTNFELDKPTTKSEISTLLGIRRSLLPPVVQRASSYLALMGFALVPVPYDTPLLDADRYFILGAAPGSNSPAAAPPGPLCFLIALLQIENGLLDEESLERVGESRAFAEATGGEGSAVEWMRKYKQQGYFASVREGERVLWRFGWRYEAEFEKRLEVSRVWMSGV